MSDTSTSSAVGASLDQPAPAANLGTAVSSDPGAGVTAWRDGAGIAPSGPGDVYVPSGDVGGVSGANRRAHGSVHVPAQMPADPLICHHGDGRTAIRVANDTIQVWLDGTLAELHHFAAEVLRVVFELGYFEPSADEVPS